MHTAKINLDHSRGAFGTIKIYLWKLMAWAVFIKFYQEKNSWSYPIRKKKYL
jgi:hypothetical protein